MINRLLVTLIILCVTSPALAGQVAQNDLFIEKILTGYMDGEAFFVIDKEPLNPNDCSGTTATNSTLAIDPAKSNVEQVLSVLLTALTTKKKIEVQIYDNTCYKGHAVIRRVAIY